MGFCSATTRVSADASQVVDLVAGIPPKESVNASRLVDLARRSLPFRYLGCVLRQRKILVSPTQPSAGDI